MIPCCVCSEFKSRIFDQSTEPAAGREMRRAERGTIHTAIARRAELRQTVKSGKHAFWIDAKLFEALCHVHYYNEIPPPSFEKVEWEDQSFSNRLDFPGRPSAL